jgi:hypothetical protein
MYIFILLSNINFVSEKLPAGCSLLCLIERLKAAKKCDRISGGAIRPLRIQLSQLKLQWGSCNILFYQLCFSNF